MPSTNGASDLWLHSLLWCFTERSRRGKTNKERSSFHVLSNGHWPNIWPILRRLGALHSSQKLIWIHLPGKYWFTACGLRFWRDCKRYLTATKKGHGRTQIAVHTILNPPKKSWFLKLKKQCVRSPAFSLNQILRQGYMWNIFWFRLGEPSKISQVYIERSLSRFTNTRQKSRRFNEKLRKVAPLWPQQNERLRHSEPLSPSVIFCLFHYFSTCLTDQMIQHVGNYTSFFVWMEAFFLQAPSKKHWGWNEGAESPTH